MFWSTFSVLYQTQHTTQTRLAMGKQSKTLWRQGLRQVGHVRINSKLEYHQTLSFIKMCINKQIVKIMSYTSFNNELFVVIKCWYFKKSVQAWKYVLIKICAGKTAFLRFLFCCIKIVVHLLFKKLNFMTVVSKVQQKTKQITHQTGLILNKGKDRTVKGWKSILQWIKCLSKLS